MSIHTGYSSYALRVQIRDANPVRIKKVIQAGIVSSQASMLVIVSGLFFEVRNLISADLSEKHSGHSRNTCGSVTRTWQARQIGGCIW